MRGTALSPDNKRRVSCMAANAAKKPAEPVFSAGFGSLEDYVFLEYRGGEEAFVQLAYAAQRILF